jgi:hypothetical protein
VARRPHVSVPVRPTEKVLNEFMVTKERGSNRARRRAIARPARGETAAATGAQAWLLLTYKVPAEPAKRRIALWRKLKALGAVYLQNGVCLLPKVESHVRRLKLLQNEITAMEGDAVLLETVGLDRVQEQKVIARFSGERNEAYQEFISRCDDLEAEIAKERGIGTLRAEAEERLARCAALLDDYAREVFEAQDENRPNRGGPVRSET